MQLSVNIKNTRAITFYKRNGFHEFRTHEIDPSGIEYIDFFWAKGELEFAPYKKGDRKIDVRIKD